MKRLLCGFVLATVLMGAIVARAEHTHFWRQSRYAEFEKGTADGVAIRSDGRLTPAPKFSQFADPNLAYLWALRMDSQGRLYAAGGPNAKVVRFDSSGKSTTVFESPELAAQDMAIDANGNLYVATSPDGKIYRVAPDGQRSVFFEPKTKYIWALAMDPRGNLFAATGDEGKIFVISPKGDGKVFYSIHDRNARTLLFDSRGDLIVGTDPSGLVIRVTIQAANRGKDEGSSPEAGATFILYETGQREVTSIQQDATGAIYASASGEKTAAPPTATAPPRPSQASAASTQKGTSSSAVPTAAPASTPSSSGPSKVFRIAVDGSENAAPERIWESGDQFVYALAPMPGGGILAGTGNEGTILQIDGREYYTRLEKASATQVTALLESSGGNVFAASSNPGKIFTLGPGAATNGTFLSEVFDAKYYSQWGRITWWGPDAAVGAVHFYVRSGNTSDPTHDWSDWAGPFDDPHAETAVPPPARYVQWKAVFNAPTNGAQPAINWVSLAYQPRNIAPVIDDIVLQRPGIKAAGAAAQVPPGGFQPVQLELPGARGPSAAGTAPVAPFRPEIPPQGYRERGYQSVLWSAHDDNDDELTYAVYFRAEGESNWRLLKDKLTEPFYSWDSTAMPDGAYYLKITASDARSNPPEDTLTTERESSRFVVANKPPGIEGLRANADTGIATVTFTARASGDTLGRAEYSLDAGEWKLLYPVSGITDSAVETYRQELTGVMPGNHTVGVRVYDRYENVTTAQVDFTAPPTTQKKR
jgi:WD40 repeat protein